MKKQYEPPKLVVLGDIKQVTQLGVFENLNGNGGWISHWGASG